MALIFFLLLVTAVLGPPTWAPPANIVRDARGHIARSAAAKAEFKRQQPCPATGKPRGACPGWVVDHVVALKRGGPDVPANMQWQTTAEGKAKDRLE